MTYWDEEPGDDQRPDLSYRDIVLTHIAIFVLGALITLIVLAPTL